MKNYSFIFIALAIVAGLAALAWTAFREGKKSGENYPGHLDNLAKARESRLVKLYIKDTENADSTETKHESPKGEV